ncbi:hypothetical protein HELRODRAFT_80706, partial [Helobdella robusta]|uniref:Uncharacterized protein n=1 Tax=Helobdella robusta TaxID=6412 RepID=T1G441_HELRO
NEKKSPAGIKWNEDNITETYHPANKTYGLQKINDPDTPYPRGVPGVDPSELVNRFVFLLDQCRIILKSD